MDSVKLMNRTDTKFILHRNEMEDIIKGLTNHYKGLTNHYRVLQVEGLRQSRYETLYYDSDNFYHFLSHQNGKLNRYKVRKRNYVESKISFLEVKFKTNKDRTIKKRVPLADIGNNLNNQERIFIEERTGMGMMLEAKLWNKFQRITLVNESLPERLTISLPERLTIDCNLSFSTDNRSVPLDNLVIAEVKQESENRHSPFMNELKRRIIRPEGISKYCLGVTMLYPHVKHNNFKEKILRIKKVTAQHD